MLPLFLSDAPTITNEAMSNHNLGTPKSPSPVDSVCWFGVNVPHFWPHGRPSASFSILRVVRINIPAAINSLTILPAFGGSPKSTGRRFDLRGCTWVYGCKDHRKNQHQPGSGYLAAAQQADLSTPEDTEADLPNSSDDPGHHWTATAVVAEFPSQMQYRLGEENICWIVATSVL